MSTRPAYGSEEEAYRRLLVPGGLFFIQTMTAEQITKEMRDRLDGFDVESSCQIAAGRATRYFGRPADILEEVREAGLTVLDWRLTEDDGDLHVCATKTHAG